MSFKEELDVYRFIMDIETYVLESTPIPFTNKVLVDKDKMYDYLDQLRSRLPKEFKECKRLLEKNRLDPNNLEVQEGNHEEVEKEHKSHGDQQVRQINAQLEESRLKEGASKLQEAKLMEKEAAEKLEKAKQKEKEITDKLLKIELREREISQLLQEAELKEQEANKKLQEIELKEKGVSVKLQESKIKEQKALETLQEIKLKEREVAEKLQEAELKERAEKLQEEKIREIERLQEEAQLKCKNMLDAAELEAQGYFPEPKNILICI